jgi:transcriptional regulator with XRE-family HTH domain
VTTGTKWTEINRPDSAAARAAAQNEERVSQFRELVFRLRTEAGLTQAELAQRMGTTQSAIARIEGGGSRPTLETLERLAAAVGKEFVVGVGDSLSENRSIAKLVREGHAVVRAAG